MDGGDEQDRELNGRNKVEGMNWSHGGNRGRWRS